MKNPLRLKLVVVIGAILFTSAAAHAERLTDIRILEVTTRSSGTVIKLTDPKGAKGNFFSIELEKDDPKAFEKMSVLLKKLSKGGLYRLDLDIPSFSPAPNGSYYRATSLGFHGADVDLEKK